MNDSAFCRYISRAKPYALVVFVLISLSFYGCTSMQTITAPTIVDYLFRRDVTLPAVQSPEMAAPVVAKVHEIDGGSTYSLRWGDLSGNPLYVVSIYPDLGVQIKGNQVSEKQIERFIIANHALLTDPRCTVGTWYDSDNGITYLDVSAVFANQHVAVTLAKEYNQISIWDLKNSKDIETGGTGDPPKNMPDIMKRLPIRH